MRAFLIGLTGLVLASCSDGNETEDCAQGVVFARPATGECQSFPTPCDVPQGYVRCCGGFFGDCMGAGANARCVDDTTDTCNPSAGGADCPGICR